MNEMFIGMVSALWLGILTSISPCPLATNIAAVSYLSKTIMHPRWVLVASAAYAAGRMIAYAAVGLLIIASLFSIPAIAQFLQQYMNRILGPLLIIAGLFLLKVLRFGTSGVLLAKTQQERLARSGNVLGPMVLGFFFALSFCPLSAGLFFGSLIPLALSHPAGEFYPLLYGLGTALPVLTFAVLIAFGVQSLSRWLRGLQRLEFYARTITGVLFIGVGMYYIRLYWLL
ncbi:MAG TPA: aromatic aminobenezylarsenical efflux permease ArsG family transporter [Thermodesulfobacteriota bacterium]|nr:aromatic aminobenezylarsenical efflux permease ArsG family transporter [Thermodesulfobacteriota bacterium]